MVEISDSDYLSPMRLLQIFAVRFVLEVLGSGGAIWGFSEASGLRDSTNFLNAPVAAVDNLTDGTEVVVSSTLCPPPPSSSTTCVL